MAPGQFASVKDPGHIPGGKRLKALRSGLAATPSWGISGPQVGHPPDGRWYLLADRGFSAASASEELAMSGDRGYAPR